MRRKLLSVIARHSLKALAHGHSRPRVWPGRRKKLFCPPRPGSCNSGTCAPRGLQSPCPSFLSQARCRLPSPLCASTLIHNLGTLINADAVFDMSHARGRSVAFSALLAAAKVCVEIPSAAPVFLYVPVDAFVAYRKPLSLPRTIAPTASIAAQFPAYGGFVHSQMFCNPALVESRFA